jgi:hypothetical protein
MAAIEPASLLDLDLVTDVRIERRTSNKEGNRQYNILIIELSNGYTVEQFVERAELKIIELLVQGAKAQK